MNMKISENSSEFIAEYQAHMPELNLSWQGNHHQAGNLSILAEAQIEFVKRLNQSYQHFMDVVENVGKISSPITNELTAYPGPKFSREDLEVLSSEKISTKFGEWFQELDQYTLLIRMPEPPLLLADRVLGIDAIPASFEKGTIWTETDVKSDSWYLHHGRMPSGIMIESGQADLLLISWLGFDFYNRGERVYRLLGCELTFYGGLPKPHETLHFDIHVDSHAKLGEVRLFFFHYDCHIGDSCRMKVRQGQAGFFTYEELKNSGGVIWDAQSGEFDLQKKMETPKILSQHKAYSQHQLEQFSNGLAGDCFGQGFEMLNTHTRTPSIPSEKMLLIHSISDVDINGGPWKRGYMRAVQNITPDDWFFKGHFKNDPCMPGTLMLEAGLQVMMIYLAGVGGTLNKDGWRFEPVPNETYKLTCRGQVIPTSKQVIYEIFVYGLSFSPETVLHADLLGTVDGLKAFHTKIGLRLVPDWPLEEQPHRQFSYDYYSLLSCALGKPSDAFGEMYKDFDEGKRVARLPAPPYHFMSRITDIQAEKNSLNAKAKLINEWDIDSTGWYFEKTPSKVLPYCVLLEAGLQPCGWLASYLGCAKTCEEELFYRNLDGSAKIYREIKPQDKLIKTEVVCKSISILSQTIIISFQVKNYLQHHQGTELLSEMDTVFGFFPKRSFENQEGLTCPDEEKKYLTGASNYTFDFLSNNNSLYNLMPHEKLLMIDKITGLWSNAGAANLGMIRAEKKVDAKEWFFKAHFFQDPVQPGSLGVEAVIQVIQFFMLNNQWHHHFTKPHFESVALNETISWKYRGQVTPNNHLVTIMVEILSVNQSKEFVLVKARASLWCDSKRIYELQEVSVRLTEASNDIS
jgi:3-hydroxymyristoyl/3-hydroxydecanoyl-(acyl carrier protein) dehydratase